MKTRGITQSRLASLSPCMLIVLLFGLAYFAGRAMKSVQGQESYAGELPSRSHEQTRLDRNSREPPLHDGVLRDLWKSHDVKVAAESWVNLLDDAGHWKSRTPELLAKIAEISKTTVQEKITGSNFPDAEQACGIATRSLALLEGALRRFDPALAEAALSARREIHSLEVKIIQAKDRKAYEDFRAAPTLNLATSYLADRNNIAMRRYAEKYCEFINDRARLQEIKIGIYLIWDKNYPDLSGGHIVRILMDGLKQLEASQLKSCSGDVSARIGELVVRRGNQTGEFLPLKRSFQISLSQGALLWGDYPKGRWEGKLTLSDLEGSGVQIPLDPPKGETHSNIVQLKIISPLPRRPELPAWRASPPVQ